MITSQVDSFERSLPELERIFPRHHAELALFKDRMPLRPQYAEYIARERSGQLFLATMRRDGEIVAYYVAQVAPGFHYADTLTAHLDICYVTAGERDRGLALPLFRCVEKELRRRGAKIWYSGYKIHNPLRMPQLLTMLGFQDADTYMVKWLGDET